MTLDEINSYLINTEAPGVLAQQQNNINSLGTRRILNYEGGDHNGGSSGLTQPQIDKMIEWARSPQARDFVNWFYKELTAAGILIFSHHVYASRYTDGGTWGRMEHSGDTDAYKYLGMLEFFNNGGAPRP